MSDHNPESRGTQTPSPNPSSRMTRRDFHRRAARVAAGLLFAASAAAAEDPASAPAKETDTAAPPSPDTGMASPSPVAPPVPEGFPQAIARARAAAPALPHEDMAELEAQVKSALDLSRALHEAATPDGSEPGFEFHALLPARKARS